MITIDQNPAHHLPVGIAYFIVWPSWKDGSFATNVVEYGYVKVAGNNVLFPSIEVTTAVQMLYRSPWLA